MSSHDNTGLHLKRQESSALLDKPAAQASLGGISRATLDRMRRRGELGVVRIGRRVFFEADDIADYIERHRVTAR